MGETFCRELLRLLQGRVTAQSVPTMRQVRNRYNAPIAHSEHTTHVITTTRVVHTNGFFVAVGRDAASTRASVEVAGPQPGRGRSQQGDADGANALVWTPSLAGRN